MSEEVNQSFTRCLVKKSSRHYKKVITFVVILSLVIGLCALILFAAIFCIENITIPLAAFAYIIMYIIFVCVFAIIITDYFTLKNFLCSIVNVHIIGIAIAFLLTVMLSCYAGVALCLSVLVLLISERYFMLEVGWRFILLCISLFVLCPLNFSFGECLKCDTVVHPIVDKIFTYELRWN